MDIWNNSQDFLKVESSLIFRPAIQFQVNLTDTPEQVSGLPGNVGRYSINNKSFRRPVRST
jgi:hypothetical protein